MKDSRGSADMKKHTESIKVYQAAKVPTNQNEKERRTSIVNNLQEQEEMDYPLQVSRDRQKSNASNL